MIILLLRILKYDLLFICLFIHVLFITIDRTVEGSPIQLKETAFQRSPSHDTNNNIKHKNKTYIEIYTTRRKTSI